MPRSEEQFKQMREKTSALIIEKALKLFAEKGYKGASIAIIAKEAGISKGLAYNYFESKEKLAEAVFDSLNIKLEEVFGELLTIDDAKIQLKMLIDKTFDLVALDEAYWRLYMSFLLNPEVKCIADKIVGNFVSDAMSFIIQIFEKLEIPDPVTEARILGGILDGICFHYMLDVANYPIEEVKESLIKRYC